MTTTRETGRRRNFVVVADVLHATSRRETVYQGSRASWKVLDFFLKIPGPGKSWKLKLKVLESPGKISLKVMHFSIVQMENKQQ